MQSSVPKTNSHLNYIFLKWHVLIYPGEYIPTPSPQPPSNTQTQYQYQPELCTSIGAFIIMTYAVALEQ